MKPDWQLRRQSKHFRNRGTGRPCLPRGIRRGPRVSPSGKRVPANPWTLFRRRDWFGLQNEDRHRSTAEAIGVTGVKSVRLQDFPQLWLGLLPSVLENFSSAQEHQLVIGRQSSVERVAAFMLEMSERSGGLTPIPTINAAGRCVRLSRTYRRDPFAFAYKVEEQRHHQVARRPGA